MIKPQELKELHRREVSSRQSFDIEKELQYFRSWCIKEIQTHILVYLLQYSDYQENQKITTHVHNKCVNKKYYDNFWMILRNIDYLEVKGLIELEKKDVA